MLSERSDPDEGDGEGERRERAAGERSSRAKNADGVKSPHEISAMEGARWRGAADLAEVRQNMRQRD